jgi:hypothetical protein
MEHDWPNTRAAAKAAGSKFYFTGEACPQGHVELKYTSNGNCTACNSGLGRRWHQANPTAARVHARRAHAKARGFPVPPWQSDADRTEIDAFIAACPAGLTVDHIVPLGHAEVVGLHVARNLAYLTHSENSRKGRKLPDNLTPAQAVERGLAIWRRDVRKDGSVNWEPYRK